MSRQEAGDIPYQEIVDRLNDMAETVAQDCIPDGRRDGNYWRGNLHGKVSVHIRGSRVGMVGAWQGQFGAKTGGNLIALIELAHGFQSHGEAVRYAKASYLGIGGREMSADDKRRWAEQQAASRQKAEARKLQADRQRAEKVDTVRSIWAESAPIAGTLAEDYLRSRSIELSDFVNTTAWVPSLRFHPSLAHKGTKHPALIGAVQDKQRKLVAIWRVFLRPDGRALVDHDGKKIKIGLGPASGGAVRLGPATPTLRLAEGIETALGVMLLTRCTASVWATLSTSGMINVEIPSGVKRVEIFADGDRHRLNDRAGIVADPPGIAAARKLQDRLRKEGIDVAIYPSPEPDDWLDVWEQRKSDDKRQRTVQYV